MKASPKVKAYIRAKERLRLESYRPHPKDRLTIGWGHTGPDVVPGLTIDMAQAVVLFDADIAQCEREADRLIKTEVNQGIYDCLVSFEFNGGGLEIVVQGQPVASRFLRAVNERRWADAVEELVCWNWSAGQEMRGLQNRRLEEALHFFNAEPWPT